MEPWRTMFSLATPFKTFVFWTRTSRSDSRTWALVRAMKEVSTKPAPANHSTAFPLSSPPEFPITCQPYRAPELVLRLEWDASVDVWSFGCVVGCSNLARSKDEETDSFLKAL